MEGIFKTSVIIAALALSGCVTQNYQNDDDTPIIQSDASHKELAMTRITLGLEYLRMGNTTQSKLNLEKAKRFAPDLVQVHTAFAHYYDTVGEPKLATQSYELALSINDVDADALNNYGVFLCKQGQYDKAEAQFLKAIAVPSYLLVAKSYENLALCQLKAKNYERYERYLVKALEHSPNSGSALLEMMRLQYIKESYVEARAYLTRYEKATRRITPAALALATKIYQKQFNTRAAKNYGAMLVKMYPHSFEAKQYMLNQLIEIEEDKLAREYAQTMKPKKKKRVVKLKPKKQTSELPTQLDVSNEQKVTKVETKKVNDVANKASSEAESTEQLIKKITNETVATQQDESEKLSQTVVVDKKDDIKENKVEPKVQSVAKTNEGQDVISLPFHLVKKGESLFAISKRYNIQLRSLMRWNGLNSKSIINIGDVIYLADPKKAAKARG